jgi:hypothetical protein
VPMKYVEPALFTEVRANGTLVKIYYCYMDNLWDDPCTYRFTTSREENEDYDFDITDIAATLGHEKITEDIEMWDAFIIEGIKKGLIHIPE